MEKLLKECKELLKKDHKLNSLAYDMQKAKDELGIDEVLIAEFLEDFTIQLLIFLNHYETSSIPNLGEAIHKNLGVARNMMCRDIELILEQIKRYDDESQIKELMQKLKCLAIRLNTKVAINTLELIDATKVL